MLKLGIVLLIMILGGGVFWYLKYEQKPAPTPITAPQIKEVPQASIVPLYIHSSAMHPNYKKDQRWYGDKDAYKTTEPQRGDVVLFIDVTLGDKELIKRIVGLPGEEIGIKDGLVYINDKVLEEPYLAPGTRTSTLDYPKEGEKIMVPEGSYYLLGDNRPASADSRLWGSVPRKNITGKVTTCYENCQ